MLVGSLSYDVHVLAIQPLPLSLVGSKNPRPADTAFEMGAGDPLLMYLRPVAAYQYVKHYLLFSNTEPSRPFLGATTGKPDSWLWFSAYVARPSGLIDHRLLHLSNTKSKAHKFPNVSKV